MALADRHRLNRREFVRRCSLAGLAAAGGLPGVGWAARGDQLHIRNYVDLTTLDPPHQVSGGEGFIAECIYRSLVQPKPGSTWFIELDAAEHLEKLDDTRYAFRLKPGLMHSNGFGEMTADDVKFSLERVVDPAAKALNAPDFGTFSHVEVHDRYSGILVLSSPYAAFLTVGIAGSTGAILSRKAVEAVGGRFTLDPPSCSGPYLFREWRAQRKTVLVRNPDWTGQNPRFSEVHIYAMFDEKVGEIAFEAGQLDHTDISVESVEPFRRNLPPESRLEVHQAGRSAWIGMNSENPALRDIRVRQAIQYAIDVDAILQAGWFGLAEPSTGPIPASMIGHRPHGLIPLKGDLGKARALLAEAGVRLPLRLRLDAANGAKERTVTQVVQWCLKRVGIETEIRLQDNGAFIDLGLESRGEQWEDLQLYFQSFIGSADPYYSMVWFTSRQIGQWNWERFSNPEFDRLNDEAMANTNDAARDRMYRRMQDLMEESGCYRFITNEVLPHLIRDTVVPAYTADGYGQIRSFRPAGTGL